jgi:glycosyltransferase involved in cell wall biosynthesis
MSDAAPLIVFSDDWGRHPSSCQHLISRVLAHRAVTWVNTIGTRPPALNWSTVTRGFGKLQSCVRPRRTQRTDEPNVAPAPRVLNPKMWPSFRSRFGRALNRRSLARALAPVAREGAPPVVVTTLPITADLVGAFPAARWVYYCVDDFSVWPGLDGRTLAGMEAELVPKVDVCVAVSETLRAHLARLGKPAQLLTHGVDLEFWRAPVPRDTPVSLASVPALPAPLVVYWGVIDRRTDLAFVRALSGAMREGTILFAGPHDSPDPELLRVPRVRTLPPIPFADLPSLASRASVLIAPYADLPVTRAMQPLKLKEYLATGKPVVVRELPATAEWAACADVVSSPQAFASAVLERIASGLPDSHRAARSRLEGEGWSAKASQFERWLDGGA